jgi:hypothetical protein
MIQEPNEQDRLVELDLVDDVLTLGGLAPPSSGDKNPWKC